jgi:hypothetical protein
LIGHREDGICKPALKLAADGEHKRYAHSLRLLVVAAARFRSVPTRLAADRAAIELQNEYLRSANLFEQQLRLLTCLARDAAGVIKPWTYWQQQNLKNLLEMASLNPALAKLAFMVTLTELAER